MLTGLANENLKARLSSLEEEAVALERAGDHDAALGLWREAWRLVPDPSALPRRMRPSVRRRLAAEDRRQREVAAGPLPAGFRHIAIAGTSYCGSTVLGVCLGSLPGVANIGESFWLARRKVAGNPPITDGGADGVLDCVRCGPECPILTEDFRAGLVGDPSHWYARIGARFGCDIVVSSDKNPAKYAFCDPLHRYDMIIMFKSPLQSWWSNYKKRDSAEFSPMRDLRDYLAKWHETYRELMETPNTGQTIFLDYGDFVADPDGQLARICLALGLPEWRGGEIDTAQHFIGGNAIVGKAYQNRWLSLQGAPEHGLPEAHVKAISSDQRIAALHAELRARSLVTS